MSNKSYHYLTNCIGSTAELIQAMTGEAKEITYDTLLKHVSVDELQEIFPYYSWSRGERGGVAMRWDFMVSYWKSTYDGRPCYYVDHSRIEYIFVEEN